jgi:peptidoglycan hydrolase-like protein with peptidoglycan-binding domain
VLVAVANRPVILLAGMIPEFRTMQRGVSGPDVDQLQSNLLTLGLPFAPDPLGVFGPGTARAVATLYTDRGFQPLTNAGASATGNQAINATVPLNEVVFTPEFPAYASNVSISFGASVTQEPLLTLSSGGMSLVGTIPNVLAGQVEPKQHAVVRFTDGRSVRATVERRLAHSSDGSGAESGSSTAPVQSASILLKPEVPLPPRKLEGTGQLTIIVRESRPGDLVIPVTGVSLSPGGLGWVTVSSDSGTRTVSVNIDFVSDGFAAISPAGGGVLHAGDNVVLSDESGQSVG